MAEKKVIERQKRIAFHMETADTGIHRPRMHYADAGDWTVKVEQPVADIVRKTLLTFVFLLLLIEIC